MKYIFFIVGQCLYKCFVCDWIGSESADFLRHIRKGHEMGYKTYLSKFDNPCIIKKMLKCQLCDQVFNSFIYITLRQIIYDLSKSFLGGKIFPLRGCSFIT